MKKPEKENISRRLIFSFFLLILIFFVFGFYSLYGIRTISGFTRTIYNSPLVVSNAALQSNVSITKMHRNMKDVVLLKSADRIQQSIAAVDQQEKLVYQYLDIVRDRILGDEGRALENESRTLFENWRPIRQEVMDLVRMGQRDNAAEITIGKGADHVADLEKKMMALTEYARIKALSFMDETEKIESRLSITTLIFLILFLTLSCMIGFFTLKRTASTEKALKESEKKYQSLFNNAQVALFRTTIAGKLIEINKRYAEIAGYSTIEDCMARFNPGHAWADPDGRNELVKIIQEKGFVTDYEAKIIPRNGTYIWILFSAAVYPEQGFIEGSLIEITERKKAKEEVLKLNRDLELRVYQRTAQLEEVNKELEDFVYSVSHDLRAPLRSISGFSEIINRRHKTCLNEEGQHYFDNIIKASRQMGELIDDLLKFSRLGRSSIKLKKILLQDVFKTALETLSGEIQKRGAQVHIPDHMPAVQGDLTLATHVFINLMGNSLKYHKPDTPLVIDVGFEIESPYVIISVMDNGIGIDPVYHEKIFKIFQRLHGPAEYPGTGIGLAAVKKALQIMKGQVWVESEPDKGSIFKVKIPMAETISE